MRTHRKHSALICWSDEVLVRELVSAQNLIAARFEPITRGLRGGAGLDLTFARDGRIAVVPLIEIVPEMLAERECSPFVWPQIVADAINDESARKIESLLLPWIESGTLARSLTDEMMRVYGDAQQRALFERARSFGFLGAAPYTEVLQTTAPYAYAARFAADARVCARDAEGANGAAILSRHAKVVRFDLQDVERNELASAWFGRAVFGAIDAPCDVAIYRSGDAFEAPVRIVIGNEPSGTTVTVATPIPTDVMFSFDPQDAPAVGHFSVTCANRRSLPDVRREVVAPEGSSGRILLLVRNDWKRRDDADTDDARALAQLLRAEGFSVDVRTPSENADPAAYDLVHAFGLTHANEFCSTLRCARHAGVPVVFTAALDDISAGGAWGAGITRTLLRLAHDETSLQDYLGMVAARRLEAPGLSPQRQELFAGYESSVREALALSDVVIAGGPSEEALLRTMGCHSQVARVGSYPQHCEAQSADEVIGTCDYILVHAPIESRCNQLSVLRAASALELPLVLAGSIVEPEYYQALRDFADDRVMFVPDAPEGVIEALYRGARVYADVAWYRYGLGRAARAASWGCSMVISSAAHVSDLGADGVFQADPASPEAVSEALNSAWNRPRANPGPVDTRLALVATAGAYDQARRSRAHASGA